MPQFFLPRVVRALRCRRGVSASEYAVMGLGLIALIAVCGQMIAAAFGPMLTAVTGVIVGG